MYTGRMKNDLYSDSIWNRVPKHKLGMEVMINNRGIELTTKQQVHNYMVVASISSSFLRKTIAFKNTRANSSKHGMIRPVRQLSFFVCKCVVFVSRALPYGAR